MKVPACGNFNKVWQEWRTLGCQAVFQLSHIRVVSGLWDARSVSSVEEFSAHYLLINVTIYI